MIRSPAPHENQGGYRDADGNAAEAKADHSPIDHEKLKGFMVYSARTVSTLTPRQFASA